jgi:hypothetical protein
MVVRPHDCADVRQVHLPEVVAAGLAPAGFLKLSLSFDKSGRYSVN